MEEKELRNIVFNPQSLSVKDVQSLIRGEQASMEELTSVFGDKDIADILACDCNAKIPGGGVYGNLSESSNLVVLWGLPHSGRTSVIFSLLALEGSKIIHPATISWEGRFNWSMESSNPLLERIEKGLRVFRNRNEKIYIPVLSKDDSSETYRARYKKSRKVYDITFFKPKQEYDSIEVTRILVSHHAQIHIFCIDCRQDIQKQTEAHNKILSYLKSNGFLDKSNGVYVLVTKTDLMNVPDLYQENAAQTLVISDFPDFWNKIWRICYDKDIYNAIPLAFSAGHFLLKDYAQLHSDYAKILMEESILPKCNAQKGFIERFLNIGGRTQAIIAACLFLFIISLGLYYAKNTIVPPPPSEPVPYDYVESFLEDERMTLKGAEYEDGTTQYKRLRRDLSIERSLRLSDGQLVVSEDLVNKCDSNLANDFAAIVDKKLNTLFSSDSWTADEGLLRRLDSQIMELTAYKTLNITSITDYHEYIHNYFYSIKPIITRSHYCYSASDVRTVVEEAKSWEKHPYNKDNRLMESLSDVRSNAYGCCADYYWSVAKRNLKNYWRQVDEYKKNLITYYLNKSKLKQSFKKQNEKMVNNLNSLIDDLRYTDDDDLVNIRKSLEYTRNTITDIYK